MSAPSDRFGTDRSGSDPYAEWDAAYVLGALSPAERLEFEGHLSHCDRCRGGVAEIAGLPGLLAQVGPEDAARLTQEPGPPDALPDTVLPEVLATLRRERSRTTRALLAVAAGVALLLAGFGLGRVIDPTVADEPRQLAFATVSSSRLTANVNLVPTRSGTRVEVECQYGGPTDPDPEGHYAEYSVVVTDRAGRASLVKRWPVKAHKVMRPSGSTPLSVSEIRDVQIRESATDEVVLRAKVR